MGNRPVRPLPKLTSPLFRFTTNTRSAGPEHEKLETGFQSCVWPSASRMRTVTVSSTGGYSWRREPFEAPASRITCPGRWGQTSVEGCLTRFHECRATLTLGERLTRRGDEVYFA